jgi:hypothetical protein
MAETDRSTWTAIPEIPTDPGFAAYVPDDRASCRFCGETLRDVMVDLGMSPLCEDFLTADRLNRMEPFYPLTVFVCRRCYLVQLQEYVQPEDIFTEYAYFSSYSTSWLDHVRRYRDDMVERWELGPDSQVVEVASNDGYALQYFVEEGIPSLGIEPAANVAEAALDKGVPTRVEFFGRDLARRLEEEGVRADLLFGKNVLAQVHDVNDFVGGMKILLAPAGVVTVEFPHLDRLVQERQFDTIYHEHFSYFSFLSAEAIFAAHGLRLFDVEELPTHGGSLRIFGCHEEDETKPTTDRAEALRRRELDAGVLDPAYYRDFARRVEETKRRLLDHLIAQRDAGKQIVGYGAPGKGNTLLNYCGIRTDFLDYTVDRNPYKHGRYTPGTRIPIHPPERLRETRPDVILILPWNLEEEIAAQLSYTREWGAELVVPIPTARVLE